MVRAKKRDWNTLRFEVHWVFLPDAVIDLLAAGFQRNALTGVVGGGKLGHWAQNGK